jgi:diguanylate cyclase (GGDEF)-like protein
MKVHMNGFKLPFSLSLREAIQRTLQSGPARPASPASTDDMLATVAQAVESILGMDLPLEARIEQTLAYLGKATLASHVYVFENDPSENGVVLVTLRQRWCASDNQSTGMESSLKDFSLRQNGFERWESMLSCGDTIRGSVRQFPNSERQLLRSIGVRSVLVVPIFIEGRWWGFLGIDDIRKERFWTAGEESALKIVANVLGAILQRRRSEQIIKRLYSAEREQRQLAQALRDAGIQMTSTLDYETILDLLLEQIQRVVPYETASVMLVKDREAFIARARGFEQFGDAAARDILSQTFSLDTAGNLQQIIETQRPLVLPDVNEDPHWIQTSLGKHVRSWAGVPIVAQERVLAIISLDKTEPNFYDESQIELLTAFANQAALALQNASLFAETTEMLNREQGLNELIRSISNTLDLPTALLKLLKITTNLVGADSGGLALLTPDGSAIRSAYTYNLPKGLSDENNSTAHTWVSNLVENQTPVLMANYARHPLAAPGWVEAGIKSFMSVPVVTGDDYLGVLVILSQNPAKRFSERDLALMESVGRHAAATIQNVWLFQAVRRRAEEAETLRQASSAVTSALDLAMVLDRILIQVARVIKYDSAAVFLVEEEGLHMVAAKGFPVQSGLLGNYFPLDNRLFQEMHRRGQPIIINDASADKRFMNWGEVTHIRGWIGLPLLAMGKAIGCLTIDSCEPNAYDVADAALVQSFANEAAIAIEKARLFQQVQQLAVTDPLTGLYNRRYFFEVGQKEFRRARRTNRPLSVIMLDVDHFKSFNDTYGHLVGDRVLTALARQCQLAVRELDVVARYGGEEFVIMLPETSLDAAYSIAERIREVLAQMTIDIGDQAVWVSVSFGVAEADDDCPDLETLFQRADKALYITKGTGRGRISVWSGESQIARDSSG